MALDDEIKKLSDSLKDVKGSGISLKEIFEDLESSLSGAGAISQDISNQLLAAANNAGSFDNILQKIRRGSISTKEINDKIAASQQRQNDFASKANQLQQQARNAALQGQSQLSASLQSQANAMMDAVRSEQMYQKALDGATKLQKEMAENLKQRFDLLGNIIGMIPGLGKVGSVIKQLGADFVRLRLEGKDALGVMKGLGTSLALLFAGAVVKALFDVNKELVDLQRNLNLSNDEAEGLKNRMAAVANAADDAAINSRRLTKAQQALNAQLGLAVEFSGEIVTTFSKLTEIVGLSVDATTNLAVLSQRTGESFREVEENTLAASYNMQRGAGVALNMRGILEATGKVTGQIRANLGANPLEIARAVTAAKLFGAEIKDIRDASNALLNFEQSIGAELEAELLTGKQLNLERARALALAGDQEGLARELANQAGTFAEFSDLNVLQQNALAQAFGMQSDQLADILFQQETQGLNAKQLRAMGKGELADRLEVLSAQERLTLAGEKFMVILGEVATVLLPVVEAFASIFSNAVAIKGALVAMVGIATTLAGLQIASAIANIMAASSLALPIAGIAIGGAAVAAMLATIAAINVPALREGGIVTARPGGAFIAGEGGESEAIIPLSKLPAIMNNIGQNSQPVIVSSTSTFSNFDESKRIGGLRLREIGASSFA